jgi:hypothetical protein
MKAMKVMMLGNYGYTTDTPMKEEVLEVILNYYHYN